MNPALVTLGVIAGAFLRFGLPIAITFWLGWYLRRLDQQWREEALEVQKDLNLRLGEPQPCWEVRSCRPAVRSQCAAYLNPNTPCWDIHRSNGSLQTACLKCTVRQLALADAVPA